MIMWAEFTRLIKFKFINEEKRAQFCIKIFFNINIRFNQISLKMNMII